MSENDVNNLLKEGIKSYKILAWRFISVLGHLPSMSLLRVYSPALQKENRILMLKLKAGLREVICNTLKVNYLFVVILLSKFKCILF